MWTLALLRAATGATQAKVWTAAALSQMHVALAGMRDNGSEPLPLTT